MRKLFLFLFNLWIIRSIDFQKNRTRVDYPLPLSTSQVNDEISNQTKNLTLNRNYWIELIVFADSSVQNRFSSSSEARNYIITLIDVTNSLLKHESLGVNISLAVLDIIWIPDSVSKEILWGASLSRSVHRFCQWAMKKYYVRYNYDHALFISRNINEAAGISPLNQMCRVLYSCTMAEDSGFFSAYPIAHEILHNLGVEHDGEGNSCDKSGRKGNIMAPLIMSNSNNHHWSDCTRLNLLQNIQSDDFKCLQDFPNYRQHLTLNGKPGWYWSLDEQCKIASGSRLSKHCPNIIPDNCRQLMCSRLGNYTNCEPILNSFLLEGSICDTSKQCVAGSCIEQKSPQLNENGWSDFTEWSDCSRPCGIGTQFRTRVCFRRDISGRLLCPGKSQEYRLCSNTFPCKESEDFREQQCTRFNDFKVRGINHNWFPNVMSSEVCRLSCRSKVDNLRIDAWSMVRDSTLCTYSDEDARCIQGKCVPFDCKGVIEGMARRDRCGVCDGDNSTCSQIVNSLFRKLYSTNFRILYIIPRQARDVRIQKTSHHHTIRIINLLDMSIGIAGETLKKGTIRRLVFHGAEFEFKREIFENSGQDFVFTNGPLKEDVAIEAIKSEDVPSHLRPLSMHKEAPIHLEISYLLPKH